MSSKKATGKKDTLKVGDLAVFRYPESWFSGRAPLVKKAENGSWVQVYGHRLMLGDHVYQTFLILDTWAEPSFDGRIVFVVLLDTHFVIVDEKHIRPL